MSAQIGSTSLVKVQDHDHNGSQHQTTKASCNHTAAKVGCYGFGILAVITLLEIPALGSSMLFVNDEIKSSIELALAIDSGVFVLSAVAAGCFSAAIPEDD